MSIVLLLWMMGGCDSLGGVTFISGCGYYLIVILFCFCLCFGLLFSHDLSLF